MDRENSMKLCKLYAKLEDLATSMKGNEAIETFIYANRMKMNYLYKALTIEGKK